MTLIETIKLIEHIASQQPNINSVVDSGDVFDLNNEEFQQKYSAFCVTQSTHTIGDQFNTYNFNLFYVDRLTFDKSNKIEIQSNGVEFFSNLLKTINKEWPTLMCEAGQVTTFNQRFSAECAGAWMTFSVTTTPESLCEIVIEMHEKLGEFAPAAFSDAFFKFVQTSNIQP